MTATMTSKIARTALVLALATGLSACGVLGKKGPRTTPTLGNRIPILSRIEAGTKVDPSIADVAVVLPPAKDNPDWPQAGYDASKYTGHLSLADNPAQVWTAKVQGSTNRRRLAAAPVIGGGLLFAVGTDSVVHAFDAATGADRWTYEMKFDSKLSSAVFGGGASYADGKLYVTNGIGEVAALDARTGKEIWRVRPAGPMRGSPTIAFNSVYVMTQDNQILSLSQLDGSTQWQEAGSTAQAGVFGVAAPAAGSGTIIAGYSTGELSAYRYENGRTLWSDALARTSISTEVGSLTDIDADPIIDPSGRVFALGQGGRMAAYELVTGQRIWELNLAGISTPAVAGEWIFTLTDDARLLAIARATGKVRWIAQLQRYRNEKKKKNQIFWNGPVLASNQLWVVNTDGQIYRVSVGEGSASLYRKLKSSVTLPPVVAGKTLYILDDDGVIHAFK